MTPHRRWRNCKACWNENLTRSRRLAGLELSPPMINLRPATRSDDNAIWEIFHAVIATGDSYPFDPQMSREDALAYWFGPGTSPYVAEHDGRIAGSYLFKPNQTGLGDHVANAAFMVSPAARGLGIGRRM